MKALSVRQPWASMIAQGGKTIETRTWSTEYRGDLLIVSSKRPIIDDLPSGKALCVAELVDCRPMTQDDEPAAGCGMYEYGIGDFFGRKTASGQGHGRTQTEDVSRGWVRTRGEVGTSMDVGTEGKQFI